MSEQWFGDAPMLHSLSYTPDAAFRVWFYEDGLKITLEQSLSVAFAKAGTVVCGEQKVNQLVTCTLPPGHECKHFPMPRQEIDRYGLNPITSIHIESLTDRDNDAQS